MARSAMEVPATLYKDVSGYGRESAKRGFVASRRRPAGQVWIASTSTESSCRVAAGHGRMIAGRGGLRLPSTCTHAIVVGG